MVFLREHFRRGLHFVPKTITKEPEAARSGDGDTVIFVPQNVGEAYQTVEQGYKNQFFITS
ncbi:MAG: hypothetical protein A3F31_00365 [Candidatus Levybacteria bacterium RIFCSPHIGHO2_12_FULL_38_12]|nr:MAG: hypothetical protein A2770_03435 [Candidatus Levybacteria bacterium RIFCSPHIGHO2_01_FULL_38_12]OGH23212.1 MAG: hypothetical protein A3F31_00365 [Candidatus Levybacteria bacterium RIFCSPHIGHO2_12_FULL_38_12]OGH34490.1 MAG: hypothetical protein A3A47_00885 [Candidatus Levybacteria bacterium RIFCSPLOWO2_01_FULL_37_20]OGH44738.1 MAG: hypothetical protein A3J14_00245 [Candidatus Levybacteria bacterium RIFCSPLOWO2_02_FULL_37_18]OGH51095.1 MAG: hypothetical protein A3G13_02480 [Candidatus Levy